MTDDTTETIAVCKNCGHTWKLRTDADKPSRRKCSKCQSTEITLSTGAAHLNEDTITTEQIAQIINTPPSAADPEPAPQEPRAGEQKEPLEPALPTIKAHPALIAIGLIALLGVGAVIYFRTRSKKPDKKQTEKPVAQQEQPRQLPAHRIAGL